MNIISPFFSAGGVIFFPGEKKSFKIAPKIVNIVQEIDWLRFTIQKFDWIKVNKLAAIFQTILNLLQGQVIGKNGKNGKNSLQKHFVFGNRITE